jgi:hypothetical protein
MLRRALCCADARDYDAVMQGGMARPGAACAAHRVRAGGAVRIRHCLPVLALAAALHAMAAMASQPTMSECFEASDFIGNAALARDAGMNEQAFIGRMEQDFRTIHAFPQQLRWFAHDDDDEAFLIGAARVVFDTPALPEEHRRAFLLACFERMGTTPAADAGAETR